MSPATSPLLDRLRAWPHSAGASVASRRAARAWDDDPALAGFATAGEAALAVGADTAHAGVVLTALAARVGDDWAATAAISGLAPQLEPIARRWARAGLAGADLDGAEADLVGALFEVLVCQKPTPPPSVVVQAAWHRVSGSRRSERARAARHVPLDDARLVGGLPARSTAETVLALLVDSVGGGRLGIDGAVALGEWVAGWPTETSAARAGVSPEALRARRHRATRALSLSSGALGGW
ncbi:MAG: hypothetical protein ACYC1D_18200 [Acidimicrobiales bacterium]